MGSAMFTEGFAGSTEEVLGEAYKVVRTVYDHIEEIGTVADLIQGVDFTGPQGNIGPIGPAGQQGDIGVQGPTGMVIPDNLVDLFIVFGQSPTISRAPQITLAGTVPPTLFMFNGGYEVERFVSPVPLSISAVPVSPNNMQSLTGFVPVTGYESLGPGAGFQSAKAGVPRSQLIVTGYGGQSHRQLHACFMENTRYAVEAATRLWRLAGYQPVFHVIFIHGHANADAATDGNNSGETPTTTAQYLTGSGKLLNSVREAITNALDYTFTGPIWVTPLLTGAGVASFAARNAIVQAQTMMPATIPGTRLLPPPSQFANQFDPDRVHQLGPGYRGYSELFGAYVRSGLTPPTMISRAVVSGKVEVTFDQAVKLSTTLPDMGIPGNSKAGFNVTDSTGTEVAVSAVTFADNKATLTVANTVGLTGAWSVRNGLQTTGVLNGQQTSSDYMCRTMAVGTANVGVMQDGTPIENFSITQEQTI